LLLRIVVAVTLASGLWPLASMAHAQTWIEITHREPMTEGRTTADVKRDALYGALAEAVRRVVGVKVSGTETTFRAESAGRVVDRYSEVVRLDAAGRATAWTVVREEWTTAKKGTPGAAVSYELTLRVRVEREGGATDPGFAVQLETNTRELVVRGNDLRENDELIVRATTTRDAVLTVVLIADDSVFVLAPSPYLAAGIVRAAQRTEIPAAELRSQGLHFRAALPSGRSSRTEIVAVIATTRPIPIGAPRGEGKAADTGALTLADFNKWLVGIPLDERAVAQTLIEVRKNR
jgi:hypothetical protein